MEIKPIFVAISDIHFNLGNLDLASDALQSAITEADTLGVPLVIAGDLNDTKAIIRAEVANRLIQLLKSCKGFPYILVGNHDLLNEKSTEHGLNYLKPYARIVDKPLELNEFNLIPYQTSKEEFLKEVSYMVKGKILVCHQGFLGAAMGDYIQDKTSIDPTTVKDFTVFSGHYHRHQTIHTVTYIGSPFTHSFGEANDGDKGFLVVNSDGSFTRKILSLRKHVKIQAIYDDLNATGKLSSINVGDLLWLQISGPKSELAKVNKIKLGELLLGHPNFKLDLNPSDSEPSLPKTQGVDADPLALIDGIIDNLAETDDQKTYLKQLWKDLI